MNRRQEFEAKHPEYTEHRDAVAAHEGAFEREPLTYRELATRAATSKDLTEAVVQAAFDRQVSAKTKTS
ncbi:hypothetical protein [Rhodococcus opacus]|uniref:hypothetical protein n=1 Tax=Rhodococcus opacus TaxID=37919 RepID=UPI00247663B0|nr:hypothetical protein [Rhodococcus opacus]